jgi:hypothetical protein
MKIFTDRFDPAYRKILLERLQLEGKNGLINTSINLHRPLEKYPNIKRICKIDLCGIAATTLFDRGGDYDESNIKIANQLHTVFTRLKELNDKGIMLRVRLLFLYQYSEYAITRIQAEATQKRTSIETPDFFRSFDFVDDVKKRTFDQSTVCVHQSHTLEVIQNYLKEFKIFDKNNPNQIIVRFTPFGLNSCILFINQAMFCDSYTLAKKYTQDNYLVSVSPLTMIDKKLGGTDEMIFNGYEDHCRYLWEHDSTLYCEDATYFDKKNNIGLADIREPKDVTFDHKAKIIESLSDFDGLTQNQKREKINDWKFKMGFAFRKLTVNLTTPLKEKLFIACGWHEENGENSPNQYAKKLKDWLNRDFGTGTSAPSMNINFVLTQTGDILYDRLYQDLQDATLAIILLTKDIKSEDGRYYSKPNLAHELGYLIKQLEGTKRVFIFYEEDVEPISNVGHITHKTFNKDDFEAKYITAVLDWLKSSGCYLNPNYLRKAQLRQNQLMGHHLV